jgi:serine/threonine protein kinase
VYTALFRGTEVAIKRMIPKDINTNMLRQFKLETAIMCTLRHPNIVLFMGSCIGMDYLAFINRIVLTHLFVDGGEMLLIMEYMNRGSLYSVLHDSGVLLPLSLRLHLAYQIASGINFLHRCNPSIIHCDIKSHNVLLDSNWCAR